MLSSGSEKVSCWDGGCVAVGPSGAAVLGPKGRSAPELAGLRLDDVSCAARSQFCLTLGPGGVAEVYNGRAWSSAPPNVVAGAPALGLNRRVVRQPGLLRLTPTA